MELTDNIICVRRLPIENHKNSIEIQNNYVVRLGKI